MFWKTFIYTAMVIEGINFVILEWIHVDKNHTDKDACNIHRTNMQNELCATPKQISNTGKRKDLFIIDS